MNFIWKWIQRILIAALSLLVVKRRQSASKEPRTAALRDQRPVSETITLRLDDIELQPKPEVKDFNPEPKLRTEDAQPVDFALVLQVENELDELERAIQVLDEERLAIMHGEDLENVESQTHDQSRDDN